jgi:hypothetical protein
MMLTSPRSLVLSITCGDPGFASPGGAGVPTSEEFTGGAPLMVQLQDIQFSVSELSRP